MRFSGGANRNTELLTSVQQQDVLDYAKVLGTDADNIRFYSYDAPSNYSDLLDTVFVGPDIYPGAGVTSSVVDRLSMRATLAHEVVGHRYSTLAGRDFAPGSYLDEFQASYRAAKLAPDLTSTERYQLLKDSVRRLHSENITVKQFKASDDFTKLYLD